MKLERRNSQKGLKLYTYLELGRIVDFRRWLSKHVTSPVVHGINEGCGSYKCSALLKAASLPEVKWEDLVMMIDRLVRV